MDFNVNEIDLKALIEYMPERIFYLDKKNHLLSFNSVSRKFFSLLGCYDPYEGMDILSWLPEEKRKHWLKQFRRTTAGKVISFEDAFQAGGDTFYFCVTLYSLKTIRGKPMALGVMLDDITEERKAQQQLEETEEKYHRLFQQNPVVMYIVALDDLRILEVNEMATKIYGYNRGEFLKMTTLGLRKKEEHRKLLTFVHQIRTQELAGSAGVWPHMCKNGKKLFMDITYYKITFQDKEALLVMANDVTQKVKLEKKLKKEKNLKEKEINEAVMATQEKERTEIGKELHDNVNQLLGLTKLYIDIARKDERHRDEMLKRSAENTMTAIDEIRRLSESLVSPPVLDIGLKKAIENLAENVMLLNPFRVRLNMDDFDENITDESFKLNLYRIIQEQLNNVIKHAEASYVDIFLTSDKKGIRVQFSDNGRGFDTSQNRRGIGITNIFSRVKLYNGEVDMISSPGQGCRLEIRFPGYTAGEP